MNIHICACAKQEKDYIFDWVKYHLDMGFTKIVIYDNNGPEEDYDDILWDYIQTGEVEINKKYKCVPGQQRNIYNEYYKEGDFDWVFFIDVDEFLTFGSKYKRIEDFLKDRDCDFCLIPWLCENSRESNSTEPIYNYNNPLPVNARRVGHYIQSSMWQKTIYKKNSVIGVDITEHSPVLVDYNGYKALDEDGNLVNSQKEFQIQHKGKIPNTCYLRHYLLRDIKTFFYNKYLRGHAGLSIDTMEDIDGRETTWWNQNLNYYTDFSKVISNKDQEFLLNKGFKVNYEFCPTIHIIIEVIENDPDYYESLMQALLNIQDSVDAQSHIIMNKYCAEEMSAYNEMGLGFNQDLYMWDNSMDLPKWLPDINEKNYFIQEPIILHIGYPWVYADKQLYINQLKDTLLNKNIFKRTAKDLIFFRSQDSILYTPKQFVGYDENEGGWFESNNNNPNIIKHRHENIVGNTFLTNIRTWNVVIKSISETSMRCNNQWIVDNIKSGYTTPYNQMMFLYPSLVKDVVKI